MLCSAVFWSVLFCYDLLCFCMLSSAAVCYHMLCYDKVCNETTWYGLVRNGIDRHGTARYCYRYLRSFRAATATLTVSEINTRAEKSCMYSFLPSYVFLCFFTCVCRFPFCFYTYATRSQIHVLDEHNYQDIYAAKRDACHEFAAYRRHSQQPLSTFHRIFRRRFGAHHRTK